jgi:hypothetical protein
MPLKTESLKFEADTLSREESLMGKNGWDYGFQFPKRAERPIPTKGVNVLKGFIFPV